MVYDPTNAPDRVTVTYAGARPARGELYLSALRGDDLQVEGSIFHTAECIRQVFLGGERRETVTDYQVLCRFDRKSPDDVVLTQRVAVYLQPQEPLYFDVVSQAVGVYTYNIVLHRQTSEAPDGTRLACVDTPKGVTQCV